MPAGRMLLIAAACALAIPAVTRADPESLPVFDAHVHYNLDEGRPLPVEQVLETWRKAGIRSVLLTSRPNDGTRELLAAAGSEFQAVAFARPYRVLTDVQTWFRDPAIYAMIERRQLPGVIRMRRRVLFRADDLLDWLDQKRAPSPEE